MKDCIWLHLQMFKIDANAFDYACIYKYILIIVKSVYVHTHASQLSCSDIFVFSYSLMSSSSLDTTPLMLWYMAKTYLAFLWGIST